MYQWLPLPLLTWGIVVAAAAGGLAGCSGDGTYQISGKVTFQNQPVPAGKIYFRPDSAKGNSGPTGYADIKNGQYNTAWSGGKGIVGGPTVVAIEGLDPARPAKSARGDTSGEQLVTLLFPQYEIQADLPKANSTKDFEVPAAAAVRKHSSGTPVVVP